MTSSPSVRWLECSAYEQALRDEFDQLYEEGSHRRRVMVFSLHDRISDIRTASAASTVF